MTMTTTIRSAHLAPENLRAAVAVLDDILRSRAHSGRNNAAMVAEVVAR